MNADEREKLLLEKVREELDARAAGLDEETLRRLRKARQRALEEPERGRWRFAAPTKWFTAGGLATAMVLVVAVSFWFRASQERLPIHQAEDVEMLTVQENLDISKDLDFYRWLTAFENGR